MLFSMRKMLPLIREAFDNKTLQMFTATEESKCSYSGPCALGVCIPDVNDRAKYDADDFGNGADSLFAREIFKCVDEDGVQDWVDLQHFHDTAVTCKRNIRLSTNSHNRKYNEGLYKESIQKFEEFLIRQEAKYPPIVESPALEIFSEPEQIINIEESELEPA